MSPEQILQSLAAEASKDGNYCTPMEQQRREVQAAFWAVEIIQSLRAQTTPQPWPPPEKVRECLAYNTGYQKWIYVAGGDLSRATGYSHYLPMPPTPEVQG